jgi:peptidoglycan/xylan/chitin deacetylase (PgdA/CDA1 family)
MTLDDVIRMAREAGYGWSMTDMHAPALERFAELVAEAEADKHNTGTHTCSDRCQRYACVAVREAVAAEREACEVLHDHDDVLAPVGNGKWGESYQQGWTDGTAAYLKAIRSRGEA